MKTTMNAHTDQSPATLPPRQSPQTTQLLLARLAIESALSFEGIATAVSGHQLLLQGNSTFTLIDIQAAASGCVWVQIRSFLGEVLLRDEARTYMESLKAKAGATVLTLSDEGVVTLSWQQEFGAAVDAPVVVKALSGMVKQMAAMHTTLQEEFYLRPVTEARVLGEAGGVP